MMDKQMLLVKIEQTAELLRELAKSEYILSAEYSRIYDEVRFQLTGEVGEELFEWLPRDETNQYNMGYIHRYKKMDNLTLVLVNEADGEELENDAV